MAHEPRDVPYSADLFLRENQDFLRGIAACGDVHAARRILYRRASMRQYGAAESGHDLRYVLARDCARVLRGLLAERSDRLAGFSVTQAIWDLARSVARPDLQPAFHAELIHLMRGLQGKVDLYSVAKEPAEPEALNGREAALFRSEQLDRLWATVQNRMDRYESGLLPQAILRRERRRQRVLAALGGRPEDWTDWHWHTANVLRSVDVLANAVKLHPDEARAVRRSGEAHLPFGVTPYYASLMDDDPEAGRDRAVRAQVLPPLDYVARMACHRDDRCMAFDFMREGDTSPVDLVTRRYPAIAILKPYNTCPQICVYCQRNWEIETAMAPDALAPWERIEAACDWIQAHPAIRELLITGGDPLALPDEDLRRLLDRVRAIPSLDLIRIGSRVPVTLPFRITDALADLLAGYRVPGHRDICVVTHIEHPYEVTPELVAAAARLIGRGLSVYNQLVYTFHVSRRFEAASLRLLLRRVGIEPYYTFVPKGKEEMRAYRVPIARVMQEQKEEARLLPGTRRTDEPVYNLPGLGKNHIRAVQHRDLISILPDGARVYEFHPWEKNVVRRQAYVGSDVPLLEYLQRLEASGEDVGEYRSIWYYY